VSSANSAFLSVIKVLTLIAAHEKSLRRKCCDSGHTGY